MAGQQFKYAYDTIGNRTYNETGGNPDGSGMHPAVYSVNILNQHTSREVPGWAETSGFADSNTLVLVNGTLPTRQWDYFWQAFPVVNNWSGVLTNLQTVFVGSTSTSMVDQVSYVPKTPENFQYDLDGNLTQDTQWNYTWDAENRLIRMESRPDMIPADLRLLLDFTYNWQGRRISKAVCQWNPGTSNYQLVSFRKFFYDGWKLLGEQDALTGENLSYTWGLDLSLSTQGAGGVGGLLWMNVHNGPNTGAYGYAYDGNGNVTGLVNLTTGGVTAKYEYGPFGEVVQMTGALAVGNPFRFSTKYQDVEAGNSYFGHRYYDSRNGRWISRDPKEEDGGDNLYAAFADNPVTAYDPLGLKFEFPNGGAATFEAAISYITKHSTLMDDAVKELRTAEEVFKIEVTTVPRSYAYVTNLVKGVKWNPNRSIRDFSLAKEPIWVISSSLNLGHELLHLQHMHKDFAGYCEANKPFEDAWSKFWLSSEEEANTLAQEALVAASLGEFPRVVHQGGDVDVTNITYFLNPRK